MIRSIAIIAGAAALAGCWGAPPNEKILTDLCVGVFEGDARTQRIIVEDSGADLATFCGCYAARTVTDGAKIDQHKDILVTLLNALEAGDTDIEDAADRIEAQIESGEIDSFTTEEFDALGDEFQDLTGLMSDAGGSCPTG